MKISKRRRYISVILISFIVGMMYHLPLQLSNAFYDQTISVMKLTNTQLGNLKSLYGLMSIPLYPIGGYLAQRFKPKYLIIVSLIAQGITGLWHSTIPSYETMIFIQCLYAIWTIAMFWSAYLATLRALGSDEEQGRIFSISEALRALAPAVAGFLFVWIISSYANDRAGYVAVIRILCMIYFIYGVLSWFIFPSDLDERKQKEVSGIKQTIEAAKIPGVWLTGAFIFFCYVACTSACGFFATYSTQVLHTSPSVSSTLQIIRLYVVPIGVCAIAGFIADRFKYRSRFMILMNAIIIPCCLVMPLLSNSMWIATVLSTVLHGMMMMIHGLYFSLLDESLVPRELTGAATGFISFICYIPDAFVYTMIGRWIDRDAIKGFNKMFILFAICSAVALALAVIINMRYVNKKKEIQK